MGFLEGFQMKNSSKLRSFPLRYWSQLILSLRLVRPALSSTLACLYMLWVSFTLCHSGYLFMQSEKNVNIQHQFKAYNVLCQVLLKILKFTLFICH